MGKVEIMTSAQREEMRASCALAAQTLVEVGKIIRVGMSTLEIDDFVHRFIVEHDAYPSPLNYKGFPKSVCTSRNEVICHGIPSAKEKLESGDIINVDVTTYLPKEHGFHGDTSATFYVGEPSDEARHVTEVARRCLELGIAEVAHGKRLGDIGAAIQEHAEAEGCSVVREYVGHGVGRKFHMPPQVAHFGRRGKGKRITRGMIFTIEPMINLGAPDADLMDDDWTVKTGDRSLSAQFEHTVLVTREGVEVLTDRAERLVNSEDKPWVQRLPFSAPRAGAEQ